MSLTGYLLSNLKQRVSAMELVPASGGCFELEVDGKLVYSKLETDEFPDEGAMLAAVQDA